jgi:DNA-binding MarR family transcriptional regulator
MKKKYQIFVSSTYEDLKDERDLVIKAILEMGHIPVGMEMFSAGDEQQWKLIQTQIDDCDYYVVISAFRYGSLDGNISYTEKEYDYASSQEIPVLGFIINEDTKWPASKVDKNAAKLEKLSLFKTKIQNKLVSYWSDKNDLYGKVSISLMKQFNTNPRTGWVKYTEQTGPEVLKEISRLSTENAELRKNINELTKFIDEEEKEKFEKTLETLKHNKRTLSFFYTDSKEWENEDVQFSLFEIFNLLAPELMIENSTKYCSHYLGIMLDPEKKERKVRNEWPTPRNYVRKILADFNVLDIIQPSSKKHSVKDKNEYWSLTVEGKKLFKEVRREILNQNLEYGLNEMPDNEQIDDKSEKK